MGEQLKKRTIEHIHHALSLAREGKSEAAETYAELAESALETAAEYLPQDDFLAFKDEVEALISGLQK
jgi:hypothetical protein